MTQKAHHSQKHLPAEAVFVFGNFPGTVLDATVRDWGLHYYVDYTTLNGINRREWVYAHEVSERTPEPEQLALFA